MMTDNDVIKALDILEKHDFFYGQRAGLELWNEKPVDVQNEDIKDFSEDMAFLKEFINRQKEQIKQKDTEIDILIRKKETLKDELAEKQAEIERLKPFEEKIAEYNSSIRVEDMLVFASSLEEWLEFCDDLKAEAYKEFAERLKNHFWSKADCDVLIRGVIDNILTELTERKEDEGK